MSLLSRYPTRRIIHPRLFWTDPVVAATATWLYSAAWCVVSAAIVLADKKSWRSVGRPATTPMPSRPSVEAASPSFSGSRSAPPLRRVRPPGRGPAFTATFRLCEGAGAPSPARHL